jgi:predicted phosphoadenosine phosphosulfate sulfurtransferase
VRTAGAQRYQGPVRPKYVTRGMDVFDAARGRVRWLFEEFEGKVCVNVSGGKDSTVVAELAIETARDLRCLPVTMLWLDQECELAATVDYQRWLASRPEVDLHWYQIPFRLFNATNHEDTWLNVWGEGEEWVRTKEPDSIHVNDFGTDRFTDLLHAITEQMGGVHLTGMRGEESPHRRLMMRHNPAWKWATWTSGGPPRHGYYMGHPIYDWSYRDVWKAIQLRDWRYNEHYDVQFRYGVPIKSMRVSNYHHETALDSLRYLQEAEPQTWAAATKRLSGINTLGQVSLKEWVPATLPYMFVSWEEYLQHLIATLVTSEKDRVTYLKRYASIRRALPWVDVERVACKMVGSVINGDLYGTTMLNFVTNSRFTQDHYAWLEEHEG